jgi:hypothetical protein
MMFIGIIPGSVGKHLRLLAWLALVFYYIQELVVGALWPQFTGGLWWLWFNFFGLNTLMQISNPII